MTINPWINFNGNAEEAFTFYQSILGGELTNLTRFKDIASEEFPVDEQDANKLMRITLQLSETEFLIGNDVPAFMGTVSEQENRSKIHLVADNHDEAVRICAALSEGGTIEVPLSDNRDEAGFSMFRDKYGIEWIVERY
jgi:PhnB protein